MNNFGISAKIERELPSLIRIIEHSVEHSTLQNKMLFFRIRTYENIMPENVLGEQIMIKNGKLMLYYPDAFAVVDWRLIGLNIPLQNTAPLTMAETIYGWINHEIAHFIDKEENNLPPESHINYNLRREEIYAFKYALFKKSEMSLEEQELVLQLALEYQKLKKTAKNKLHSSNNKVKEELCRKKSASQ